MKAIVCNEYGAVNRLEYADLSDPQPASDEVVIRSISIGVNFPDALLVQGLYQAKPPTPFTPGMEVVGTIEQVGSDVTQFKPGQMVAAISQLGTWAELVKCKANTVFTCPPDAKPDEVVALLCGYGTSHHALKQRGQLQTGETLVVSGASGLTGLAAVQIGKIMGARVIGVASSTAKQKIALENGADIAIGYDNLKEDIKQATEGKGADVVYDVVGGEVFDACSRAMAWGGRLLVIGFASGIIPKFPINLALVKGYCLVGVFWGTFTQKQPRDYADNMKELMAWYGQGKIAPHIGERFALKDASNALQHILDRKAVGKIVLKP